MLPSLAYSALVCLHVLTALNKPLGGDCHVRLFLALRSLSRQGVDHSLPKANPHTHCPTYLTPIMWYGGEIASALQGSIQLYNYIALPLT